MGVKFGTKGPLLRWHGGGDQRSPAPCQISPPSVRRLGYRTPKLTFLLRFDQNVEYKRPAGAYPLRDFHKICRDCTPFQDALAVKILLDLLKGLWSYEGFKLTGSGYPQILSAPSGETMHQTPKIFTGARVFLSVCLSVCLSVRRAFERQSLCARFCHEGGGVQKRF